MLKVTLSFGEIMKQTFGKSNNYIYTHPCMCTYIYPYTYTYAYRCIAGIY